MNCLNNFELSLKCRHYGKRKRNERSIVNDQSLIGKKHSFGNRGNKQYVKCGFCSDFYLKGTLSHILVFRNPLI